MKTSEDLKQILERIDHRGYPAYKDTRGVYQFGTYILGIDHVQGDPFAAPSRLHIQVAGRAVRIPKELYDSKHKKDGGGRLSAAKFCKAAGTAFVSGTWFRKKRNYSGDEMWSGSAGTYGV